MNSNKLPDQKEQKKKSNQTICVLNVLYIMYTKGLEICSNVRTNGAINLSTNKTKIRKVNCANAGL
jgi:hypothetical protein